MPTVEELASLGKTLEASQGTAGACTTDDYAVLACLYGAVYPNATAESLIVDVWGAGIQAWSAYRDGDGEIRVAMLARPDGTVLVVAKPEECELPEIQRGFVMLAGHVHKATALPGVSHLVVVHGGSLNGLGDSLEKAGFASSPTNIARLVHFSDSGEVARTS